MGRCLDGALSRSRICVLLIFGFFTEVWMRRRDFLCCGTATLALLPASNVYANEAGDRLFIFVFAQGGWDPLCVFAPQVDDQSIQMEAQAEPITIGGVKLVDGPRRPSVREFLACCG